jgi:predicted dehydrogenase
MDHTAHTVDLLRFLLRDEIEQAYCGRGPQILGNEVEEDVLGIFNLRRSAIAMQTHDSFLVAPTPISLELYGNSGTLIVYDAWRSDRPSELWLHRHGQQTHIPTAATNAFFATAQAFVGAVRTQGAPLASGADGVNNLAILHAAALSLARGQRVPVALPMRRATDRAY